MYIVHCQLSIQYRALNTVKGMIVKLKDCKEFIRRQLIQRRSLLSDEEIRDKSNIIVERLKKTGRLEKAGTIMAYMCMKSEVFTRGLINDILAEGRTVCLPIVVEKEKKLEIYKIENIDSDVEPGAFGIYEPVKLPERIINPADIDLVLVPGVGFDIRKNRIGFGGGYYDRFLSQLRPETVKIGLSFDCQVIHELPVEKFDEKMDIIITESRILT